METWREHGDGERAGEHQLAREVEADDRIGGEHRQQHREERGQQCDAERVTSMLLYTPYIAFKLKIFQASQSYRDRYTFGSDMLTRSIEFILPFQRAEFSSQYRFITVD